LESSTVGQLTIKSSVATIAFDETALASIGLNASETSR
jgi:hypothetical protein